MSSFVPTAESIFSLRHRTYRQDFIKHYNIKNVNTINVDEASMVFEP